MIANAEKWASPIARETREAQNKDDLLVSDMESSARLRSHEDDDAVLVDKLDFADSDPRLRASQVGALLEDDEDEVMEDENASAEEEDDKDRDKEKEEEKEDPIYFQGDNNEKGFEVDTPQVKPPAAGGY